MDFNLQLFAFLSFPHYWFTLKAESIRSLYSEEYRPIPAGVIGTGIGIYHQRQGVKCRKVRSSEMLRQPFKGIWNSNQSTLLLVKVDAPHYISACAHVVGYMCKCDFSLTFQNFLTSLRI